MSTKDTGDLGERLARGYLRRRGYRILETNYRCPRGEIDIIARKGDYLVFVEVRARTSLSFGRPEESVTAAKKAKLINTALHYRQEHENLPPLWRIDFVAVSLDQKGKSSRIELIENAITGD